MRNGERNMWAANNVWRVAVLVAVVTILASPAVAQRPRTFEPSRPTFSPYFGLFQVNTTPLPNYQALVKPRQEMRRTLERDQVRFNQIERQIQLRDTSDRRTLMPRTSGSVSRAATFMNVDAFYPLQGSVQRRRR